MKKFHNAAAAVALAILPSCSSDDEPASDDSKVNYITDGAFILNQGNYDKKIEGSLNVLDYTTSTLTPDIFMSANGRSIGSTPQCGVVYGSKIYVGMYESNTIEILDRATYKSVRQINLQGSTQGQNPRSMAVSGGKIYISMYDGYLARLDTASMAIDGAVKVGPNPEIIAIKGNEIYVPNSDGLNWQNGYGTTASIVSINPFKEVRTITVPLNPAQFIVSGQDIFLLAKGDYMGVASALHKMGADGSFTEIAPATIVASRDRDFYLINAPWGAGVTYSRYNASTGALQSMSISNIDNPSAMAVDPKDGTLLISSYPLENGKPSYLLPGYICRFSASGSYIDRFDIGVGSPCIFFTH